MRLDVLAIVASLFLATNFGEPSYAAIANLKLKGTCPWKKFADVLIATLGERVTEPKSLSRDQAQVDLDCLKLLFAKQYIAEFEYQQDGIDLIKELDVLSAGLPLNINSLDLLQKIIELHRSAYDAHLNYSIHTQRGAIRKALGFRFLYYTPLAFSKASKGYRGIDDPELIVTGCDAASMEKSLAIDGRTVQYHIVAGRLDTLPPQNPITSVKCNTLSGNVVVLPLRPWLPHKFGPAHEVFHFKLEDNILYVRVPPTGHGVTPTQRQLLDLLGETANEYPIIFDLRGNTGGDNSFAIELGLALRASNQKNPKISIRTKDGPLAKIALANSSFIQWKELMNDIPELADQAKKAYDSYFSELLNMETEGVSLAEMDLLETESNGSPGQRLRHYSKPIIILVDKLCGSSCEFLVDTLIDLPSTELIGTHTAGAVRFGNVGHFLLPNSRIETYFGSRSFGFASKPQEGIGFKPDYYVLEGLDSLVVARNRLKSNQ